MHYLYVYAGRTVINRTTVNDCSAFLFSECMLEYILI